MLLLLSFHDNTPAGAAMRIRYVIEHGKAPLYWEDEMSSSFTGFTPQDYYRIARTHGRESARFVPVD